MSLLELFLIAVGLSMDAFAVAICKGLSMRQIRLKKALIVGLYFGIFQAVMPLLGYLLGARFADKITAYDHWIAFVLLAFIGGKMIKESFGKESCPVCPEDAGACPAGQEKPKADPAVPDADLSFRAMLPLAVATSIDALAVGVSFAFLKVDIFPAISFIGATTLLLSMAGVKLGNVFGLKFKSKAELAGGIILVLIGLKIVLEHTGVLHF